MASSTATPATRQATPQAEITAIDREPRNPKISTIVNTLEGHKGKIEVALGKGLSADRVIQIARLIVFKTPDLQKCEASSILAAILRASTLRLDLEPSAMEAYLIPRWNSSAKIMECNFQIGYQGIRKLVYRGRNVAAFETILVYENEVFKVQRTPRLKMFHEPIFDEAKRGAMIGGYGYGRLRHGDPMISYMSRDEILRLKARGKGSQPAWQTDFEQMGVAANSCRFGRLAYGSGCGWEAVAVDSRPELIPAFGGVG